ncbi:hypothetical protein J0B02_16940 [Enterobacteriaceae bacterium YMB-R22]|jgi:hypothetical protein|uniref:cellulose biosynthesis protein BcsR n=1 Tax=Tenebrionicola larvae TaxID=2815733 RepID=UPI0020125147|nr:cellulose biosynthesis protein BcsR [Tenebrionicola larvae]MBV4414478.1 hypothetical protein [Tenebrionicola larvae]
MNEKELAGRSQALDYAFQNDLQILSRVFSLPDIDYTDIYQRDRLVAAIERWPLLAEFAQH